MSAEPGSRLSFLHRLAGLIEASGKTQKAIAQALGYAHPNIISMFKQGTTRVPFDRLPALARALDADGQELAELWLRDYDPGLRAALEILGWVRLTEAERGWIEGLRGAFPGGVPEWDQARGPALRAGLFPGG